MRCSALASWLRSWRPVCRVAELGPLGKNEMKSKFRRNLLVAYVVLFLLLIAKAEFAPQSDGGEWFVLAFLSWPASWVVEIVRSAGYFPRSFELRAITSAVGTMIILYVACAVIERLFRKKMTNKALKPTPTSVTAPAAQEPRQP